MNVRAAAANVLYQVVDKGVSLSSALPTAQQSIKPRDHALLQEICYGALRYLPRLESISGKLMDKPLKGKQRVFHHLILVGIYQLSFMRIPAHAAVGETVEATKSLKGPRLRGLINAVLRNYQRNQAELDSFAVSHQAGQLAHPSWLVTLIQNSYPDRWQEIMAANNQKAPMWLRVNRQHHTRDQYLTLLSELDIAAESVQQAPDAIKLSKPCDVSTLPGFEQGWVSVQDAAAQLSVEYLDPQPGELILDCCAAPGGKTAHILERSQNSRVVALDCDETRLKRVHDNLQRLQLSAQVLCGDARSPQTWWQSDEKFDRILLDAPCSALGVVRRHPDIKWLRRQDDIAALTQLQSEIMDAMWALLRAGGTMVYATCSITPQENTEQVAAFLARTHDANLADISKKHDSSQLGQQILPGEQGMDGFYYAVIQKQS
ncbi:16S rRNA (cytosine(967)-C(5))-methyltransferase RsmB [Vibrio sp. S4M6]|uniref:16S rRNA (cytosine(967)-C(5))-methyltransferase RsmB n=1 Tax=Vibrio sinus TaxID=2946865 RepID=UPI002029BB3A|nr:16S rRNA (cytosine(967)-C(5))-methyltransferase RsmB [Vibrio sinus]MCL9783006.1 16S rRNA (cytosine(967)-C(5))-methyltransferase RsmB [Vibrio sinus]